jgi:arabinogalactan endo-1,4-beta-galactosidase
MRTGNEISPVPDALEVPEVVCDLNAPLVLPETVNAVMTDNTRRPVPVVWNLSPEEDLAMHAAGPKQYEITGEADGLKARCLVSMVEYNYLRNYSFEEGDTGWIFTDLKHADELYVEDKKTDSLTGSKHAHFWSAEKNSVEFTLEQEISDLPKGKFRFSVSVMGGDCGETDIRAYVKVDGKEVARSEQIPITGYNSWNVGTVPVFDHPTSGSVTVGIYVKCSGEGNGAWGKIDDAALNSIP